MKKLILLISCLFTYFQLHAQSFYTCDISYANSTFTYSIHKVTITPAGVQSELMTDCGGQQFFSIAAKGNTLYWLSGNYLFKGDINNNSITNCQPITQVPMASNSLAMGSDNKVYYTGSNLFSTDVSSGQSTNLGVMPYYATGDITFYKGGLYMASAGLVKVDLTDPTKSFVYMPMDLPSVYGLVTVSTSIHKNTVYALASNDGWTTQIYELDIENKKTGALVGTLPYAILDSASPVEDGSILGININKINVHQDCAAPSNGIAEIVTEAHTDQFTYKLNIGATNTTGMFTGLAPGNYSVTVTSPLDMQTANFTVPAYTLTPPVYTYTLQKQVCDTLGQVTFTTPDNNTTYKVSLGNDIFPLNHTFTGLVTNTYNFKILNESGCEVTHININVPRDKCTIQFDAADISKDCGAVNKGNIKIATKAHNDSYTYTLNGNTNTTGIFNLLDPGNYNITITSPEDAKTITATIPDYSLTKPVITYTVINPVCDTLGSIKLDIPNSSAYQIKKGTDIFPFSYHFTGLTSGTYHFTILNLQQCVVDELDVTLKQDKCTIKFDNIDIHQQCDAVHKGVIQVFTKPHYDQYTYTLNSVSNTTGVFSNLDAGDYLVKVKSSEDEINIQANIPDYKSLQPEFTFIAENPACASKGNIQFHSNASSNLYLIQLGSDVFPFDHTFNGLSPGKYHFTVLTSAKCMVDNYDVDLQYQPCPIVIDNINAIAECNVLGKGLVKVTCPPIPETYSYELNNITNTTGVFNMLDPGTYTLMVSASGGSTPQQRDVIVPDFSLNKPVTIIDKKYPVCDISGQVNFNVGGNPKLYDIAFNSSVYPSGHVFTGLFKGSYHFDVLKKDGCIVDAIDLEMVQEQCSPVSFPSSFTPNNDGINDIFRANPESKGTNFIFRVFDRWGTQLFTSMDLHNGWNGEYKGKPVPVATYYWIATFINQENKPVTQKGSVTLIR
jgi:gliding motility-associated-like protein